MGLTRWPCDLCAETLHFKSGGVSRSETLLRAGRTEDCPAPGLPASRLMSWEAAEISWEAAEIS